jgi:hypothetical protein
MIAMLNPLARARLELYMQRLDYHLSDLPRWRRRQIRREIRDNLAAAAADVGPGRALANLGHPRVLASGYVAAEGRPLPQLRKGAWWALAVVAIYFGIVLLYAMGFSDGGEAAAGVGTSVRTSFLWATVRANGGVKALSAEFNGYLLLLPPLLAFLLAGRIWRALPPLRRRLRDGSSDQVG